MARRWEIERLELVRALYSPSTASTLASIEYLSGSNLHLFTGIGS